MHTIHFANVLEELINTWHTQIGFPYTPLVKASKYFCCMDFHSILNFRTIIFAYMISRFFNSTYMLNLSQ